MTEKEYVTGVDAWGDKALRFALRVSGNKDLSQDMVQEAFVDLWRQHKRVDYAKGKNYLFSAVYHHLIDYFRHRKVERQSEDELLWLAQQTEHPRQDFDMKETIDKCMLRLPEVQRALLQLRDVEGLSYEMLSKTLEISEKQVQVYLSRARSAMKTMLMKLGY
ncbi:MAG: sigma-70 family RNA polymerase sigma factor [Bacteroidales bacterium]|nr:sigma-70 family RNA polymerase sigma factor [Bacteroidales bacterium]